MTGKEKFEVYFAPLAQTMKNCGMGSVTIERRKCQQWQGWQAALASQQPADDFWIELEEGAIPVHPETLVEIKMRNGATEGPEKAGGFSWYIGNEVRDEMGCDIIAYRVVKP